MKKIAVTGGSGGAGQYVVRDLLEHGYEVLNLDIVPSKENVAPFRKVDLTDYGNTFAAMHGCDAVVHLAANPEPDFDFFTGADRFQNNTISTYNVFQTAVALKMERVVWASSETVLGFPFEDVQPDSVPVNEDHQKPQNSYALSKFVCEKLAEQMNILYGIPIIGLRFSNIFFTGNDHHPNVSYDSVSSFWSEPFGRRFNLWGYIDARDIALSVRLSLEANISTAEAFIIAAPDTIMNQTNAELMEAVFPGVPILEGTGEFESLLSTKKAREMLGFEPQYSWRGILNLD